jgi:dihydrofolate reductase
MQKVQYFRQSILCQKDEICSDIKISSMRKIILQLAVSLDGFIEGPNGEFDWCFSDQDYGMSDFFKRIDAVFMGRKSYERMQNMEGGSGLPEMKTYVFSNTLTKVGPGASLISGDIKKQITALKKEAGKDIWLFGGASLTGSLMNLQLVDEISLAVHPIILGKGKPLFHDISKRIKLVLTDTKTYNTGLVMVTYNLE